MVDKILAQILKFDVAPLLRTARPHELSCMANEEIEWRIKRYERIVHQVSSAKSNNK